MFSSWQRYKEINEYQIYLDIFERKYLLAPFHYASVAPVGRPITCSVSLRKRSPCGSSDYDLRSKLQKDYFSTSLTIMPG